MFGIRTVLGSQGRAEPVFFNKAPRRPSARLCGAAAPAPIHFLERREQRLYRQTLYEVSASVGYHAIPDPAPKSLWKRTSWPSKPSDRSPIDSHLLICGEDARGVSAQPREAARNRESL